MDLPSRVLVNSELNLGGAWLGLGLDSGPIMDTPDRHPSLALATARICEAKWLPCASEGFKLSANPSTIGTPSAEIVAHRLCNRSQEIRWWLGGLRPGERQAYKLWARRTTALAGASQCHRNICLKIMATSNYLRVIAFTTLLTFTLAIESASLNSFSESAFRNGNASLDIFRRSLHFAHLSLRQLQCDVPGDSMIPHLSHPCVT